MKICIAISILCVTLLSGCSVNKQQIDECEVKCQHNQGIQTVCTLGGCTCLDGAMFDN